jgi:hypothetical protein
VFRGPGKVTGNQCNLRFGKDAARTSDALSIAEPPRCFPQQLASTPQFTQLGHGNAAQGKRGRIIPERYPIEGAQEIAPGECQSRGVEYGIHGAIQRSEVW